MVAPGEALFLWTIRVAARARLQLRYCLSALRCQGGLGRRNLRQQLLDAYLAALSKSHQARSRSFPPLLLLRLRFTWRILAGPRRLRFSVVFTSAKLISCRAFPYALKNIRWLLHNAKLPIELPTLLNRLSEHVGLRKAAGTCAAGSGADQKSRRTHLPAFRFTMICRKTTPATAVVLFSMVAGLPKPRAGKERFKQLTGKDAPGHRLL